MPTARRAEQLCGAIEVAAANNCFLLMLCSMRSLAEQAAELAGKSGVECAAIDMNRVRRDVLPSMRSDGVLSWTPFRQYGDLSRKRNLGLLVALLAGWRKIAFLDDDITVPDPVDFQRAAGLLDDHVSVGLQVGGFPDNSVVCHANRAVGGFQRDP